MEKRKNKNIVFRRIKGRIVPIRKKKGSDIAKSIATAGAGVAIAAGAGKKVGSLAVKAGKVHQESFDFFQEKKGSKLPKGIKSVGEGFQKAQFKMRKAKAFRLGGQFFGGVLISRGVRKFLRSQGVEDSVTSEVVGEVGSQAAAAVVAREVNKSFGVRSKFKLPPAVKRVAKDIAVKFVKRQLRFKGF